MHIATTVRVSVLLHIDLQHVGQHRLHVHMAEETYTECTYDGKSAVYAQVLFCFVSGAICAGHGFCEMLLSNLQMFPA